ncbi:MAG: hypothetical protein ABI305_14115 [Tepidiformaceae bacterium]
MWTTPSTTQLIEGIILSLNNDLMPELQSQKAQTAAVMMQVLLQCIAQKSPVEQQIMTREHNEMTAVLRDLSTIMADTPAPAAERIRQRANDLGQRPDVAEIPSYEAISTDHAELSTGLVRSLDDIDELIRGGDTTAPKALLRLREHLGPRTLTEFGTYVVGAGMAGRG